MVQVARSVGQGWKECRLGAMDSICAGEEALWGVMAAAVVKGPGNRAAKGAGGVGLSPLTLPTGGSGPASGEQLMFFLVLVIASSSHFMDNSKRFQGQQAGLPLHTVCGWYDHEQVGLEWIRFPFCSLCSYLASWLRAVLASHGQKASPPFPSPSPPPSSSREPHPPAPHPCHTMKTTNAS